VIRPGLKPGAASALVLMLAMLAAGCSAGAEDPDAPAAAPPAVQVGQENVLTVTRDRIVSGPLISGELRAANEATVRAELAGAMLQVVVEEGQPVRKGALLGRIEATTLDDTRRSAESAVRNAESQLSVARREAERTKQLVAAGALAARDAEIAAASVTTAEAAVDDARARLVTASKQLGNAVLRSPINGVVGDRAVNQGDVVSVGTALFTIIDPSSMRLEASVPSEDIAALKVGAAVQFNVRGYDQPFEGRIDRISPQADPTTRQVPIFVSVPNTGGRLVAGLFAEGRVVLEAAEGLVVPLNAVNTTEAAPWVMRVTNGTTEKVQVTLGLRDPRTERVHVVSGLKEGDVLLRGAAQGITPGTPVNAGSPK
jgi:membrane fusion protein (multidrug efflux system)